MSDHNKLAQRIVALGFGVAERDAVNGTTYYRHVGGIHFMSAEAFCNDGRVVLALMEKCSRITIIKNRTQDMITEVTARSWHGKEGTASNYDDTVAIEKACCEALEEEE